MTDSRFFEKDFDGWNESKKKIHSEKERPFFDIGEIWFCALGTNVGFEQDGMGVKFLRPAIVLRKFNNEVLWVIPLTKNQKEGPYYFQFSFEKGVVSSAILSQIRLMDAKRLMYLKGRVPKSDFKMLKEKIKNLLD